jgi:hypothetical protein
MRKEKIVYVMVRQSDWSYYGVFASREQAEEYSQYVRVPVEIFPQYMLVEPDWLEESSSEVVLGIPC